MKLAAYRQREGLSLAAMAVRLTGRTSGEKISASMVERWEKGTIPRRTNMERIQLATDGAVTFADFYADISKRRVGGAARHRRAA